MNTVRYKKLSPNAVTPFKAHVGDAGWDLTAISSTRCITDNYSYIEYDTGLAFEIPEGYVGLLFPRSSICNMGLILANSVGVIDSNYRGSVKLRFKHIPDTAAYNTGDRVGQLVVVPIITELEEVDELPDTDRADGGFGSTNLIHPMIMN